MIRAIRPCAVSPDDTARITGWNILPNVGYTLVIALAGIELWDANKSVLMATGQAEQGSDQAIVLTPEPGHEIGMLDLELGWHLRAVVHAGTSEIRLGPMVDLPDVNHPIYLDENLALAKARADLLAGTHMDTEVTVTCPQGLGAGLGDSVHAPVDDWDATGQVEHMTWTATPDGTSESAVIHCRSSVCSGRGPFILWLDASKTESITTSGLEVTGWQDQTQHQNHAYAVPLGSQRHYWAGGRPVLGADANGWPHVRFDYQQSLEVQTLMPRARYVEGYALSDWTTAVVGSLTAITQRNDFRYMFGCGLGAQMSLESNWGPPLFGEGYSGFTRFGFEDDPLAERFVAIMQLRKNVASAAVNGVVRVGTVSFGICTPYSSYCTLGFRPGSGSGPGSVDSAWLLGTINEAIMIQGAPGWAFLRRLEGYLAHKWGLADKLPLLHPYRHRPARLEYL